MPLSPVQVVGQSEGIQLIARMLLELCVILGRNVLEDDLDVVVPVSPALLVEEPGRVHHLVDGDADGHAAHALNETAWNSSLNCYYLETGAYTLNLIRFSCILMRRNFL